jgi:hypothetical protein
LQPVRKEMNFTLGLTATALRLLAAPKGKEA